MPVLDKAENVRENAEHYDRSYRDVDVDKIVEKINDFDNFFHDATRTDTSWYGLFQGGFPEQLAGRRVLELGCGDGLNALCMAKLGAQVTAVDISKESPRILNEAARQLGLQDLNAIDGDFAQLQFDPRSFDYVVGKAFLHHLTHELEGEYLAKAARLLKCDGEARFFEPAINSKLLDQLRWLVPVPGRPSRLRIRKFAEWKARDPHPDRDDSTAAYVYRARRFFAQTEAFPLGAIQRTHRFLPQGEFNRSFRRWAFRLDARMPRWFQHRFARAQLLVYRQPRA